MGKLARINALGIESERPRGQVPLDPLTVAIY